MFVVIASAEELGWLALLYISFGKEKKKSTKIEEKMEEILLNEFGKLEDENDNKS